MVVSFSLSLMRVHVSLCVCIVCVMSIHMCNSWRLEDDIMCPAPSCSILFLKQDSSLSWELGWGDSLMGIQCSPFIWVLGFEPVSSCLCKHHPSPPSHPSSLEFFSFGTGFAKCLRLALNSESSGVLGCGSAPLCLAGTSTCLRISAPVCCF